MKKRSLSTKELLMVAALLILVVGVVYYMGFYQPLQNEITDIRNQSSQLDAQIVAATSKLSTMNAMQAELDEILAQDKNHITEIAPFDNKLVVMSELHGILASTLNYNLSFSDPAINEDGTVRRNVSVSFSCQNYKTAKAILDALASNHWRCLVNNVSINGTENDVMQGQVSVSTTITFFESTKLS